MKPLTDKNELIIEYWPHILPGMLEVIDTAYDEDVSKILTELMNGVLLCWVWPGTDGRKIDGFVTTCINEKNTCPVTKSMLICQAWVHHDIQPLTLTQRTHEFMTEWTRQMGCTRLLVRSTLDISRWMKHYGFKPGYTEYVKEVKQ